MSYLVQASGALRIYTLVDLKALEDERKKFDKRKIHGLTVRGLTWLSLYGKAQG